MQPINSATPSRCPICSRPEDVTLEDAKKEAHSPDLVAASAATMRRAPFAVFPRTSRAIYNPEHHPLTPEDTRAIACAAVDNAEAVLPRKGAAVFGRAPRWNTPADQTTLQGPMLPVKVEGTSTHYLCLRSGNVVAFFPAKCPFTIERCQDPMISCGALQSA